jgi:calcium-dependent protein kinase
MQSERIRGRPRDLWSAGVFLFALLFGELPFWATFPLGLQLKIMQDEPTFPPDPEVSEEARDLLARFLVKDPAARCSAAEALQHPWMTSA